jgi:hypothetical protein
MEVGLHHCCPSGRVGLDSGAIEKRVVADHSGGKGALIHEVLGYSLIIA